MIAVDTNILVYAHRRDSIFHAPAKRAVATLAQAGAPWAIPWPCLHEFYSIVTSVRAYKPASTPYEATDQLAVWLESPALVLLHESGSHWATLQRLLIDAHVAGGLVHDARIAAICADHEVDEFWSADRDFNRFPALKVTNPLVGPPA